MPVTFQRREKTQAVHRTMSRNIHAPYAARQFARAQLVSWGLLDQVDVAELVVSELASNAFQHGTGIAIDVRLILSEGLLGIVVWDANGSAFPSMAAADLLEENGRGLALVDALTDDWGSQPAKPEGKIVWANLKVGQ